jgi:hypothetical protein
MTVARHRGTPTSVTHDPYTGVDPSSDRYEVYPTKFSETLPNTGSQCEHIPQHPNRSSEHLPSQSKGFKCKIGYKFPKVG